jgi:hypothetical protein
MDLFHGKFRLSEYFAEGYDDPTVVGRKLSVRILGQELRWETEGFEPVLHMPAHPADKWALALFLADAHVAPILERWQIGFEPQTRSAPISDPFTFRVNGTTVSRCTGDRCPTVFQSSDPTMAPSNCGGAGAPDISYRVHQRADASDSGYRYWNSAEFPGIFDQSFIIQCCLAGTDDAFLGEKSCPDFDGMWATPSMTFPNTCGKPAKPGTCKACQAYPTNGKCAIQQTEAGLLPPSAYSDPLAPGDDKHVYDLNVRYDWICGDGVCDYHVDRSSGLPLPNSETCASCPEDCATCILGLAPSTLFVGLKNSDDQGTRFDLRTELLVDGAPIASGLTRCIDGVTRNADLAKEVSVAFGAVSAPTLTSGDVVSLRVSTRVGTNPDDSKCPGHANAVGLRLYYDGTTRPSRMGAQISPDPLTSFYLRAGANLRLDAAAPTESVAKTQDSAGINFAGGNAWREIGVWKMTM